MRVSVSAPDDRVRETFNRLLDSLRGQLESELGSCQEELVRASDRQIAEMREASEQDAEEQRAQFTTELEELQRLVDDAQRQSEEAQRLAEGASRETDSARQEVESARQDADAARQEAESARQEAEYARQQISAAQEDARVAREEAQTAKRELESARQDLDATRDHVEAALRDIESARLDSDAVRHDLNQLREVVRLSDARTAQATRLLDAVRSLDEAVTFSEVLENLAQRAGSEAGRGAVFLVKGDRLRDWRTVGFEIASDAARIDIRVSDSGLMAQAVQSGRGTRSRGNGHSLPEFARNGDSREGAAWPVSVAGSVVAVLYADGPLADNPDESYWPAFLEVLARHGGRVLEGITVRQAAGLITFRPLVSPAPSSSIGQPSGSIQ
jgi:hypothetical protein